MEDTETQYDLISLFSFLKTRKKGRKKVGLNRLLDVVTVERALVFFSGWGDFSNFGMSWEWSLMI
jgi:hypothetical protein